MPSPRSWTTSTFAAPVLPIHSNETAAPYPGDLDAMRAQLARQLSHPVRFVEMIESMYARGARTFVEVGPSSILTGLIGSILDGRDHLAVPLDKKRPKKPNSGLSALFDGLGRLAAAGIDMRLDALWREYGDMPEPARHSTTAAGDRNRRIQLRQPVSTRRSERTRRGEPSDHRPS